MNEAIGLLTTYVESLAEALESDGNANDRPLLTKRLAAAAQIYAQLHRTGSVESAKALVQQEAHAHGWSYIAGPSGQKIASQWVLFAAEVGIEQ